MLGEDIEMECENKRVSFAVGKLASNFRAELQAIREATNILIERNTTNSNIIILSDCRAALQSLQSEARDEVVEIIFRNLGQLQTNNTLALQWIPAHCGLFGNEEADRLAKDGSSKPQPPAKISFQETKTLLKNSTSKAWKNRINIKYLKDNIHDLPRNFQTTIFRLRTGHCRLNAHMHRLKISSTPLCDCGPSPQTPEHVLMSCPLTEQLRRSTWPTETPLEEKLWGTREELLSTASFIEETCIKV